MCNLHTAIQPEHSGPGGADQYRCQHLVPAQRHPWAWVPGIHLRVADQVLATISGTGGPSNFRDAGMVPVSLLDQSLSSPQDGSGGESVQPQHIEHVDAALTLHDQVGD